ncbi:MAG: lyase family protein [Fimbriimonadaceae bacterium]|jgi:argininosuccinate lyase|nr:lyase family protein [Fimbriimonadaceae bacterium]
MSKPLWNKGEDVDQLMLAFTIGEDRTVDQAIVFWDCLASWAHATMLTEIGFLTIEELSNLTKVLAQIAEEFSHPVKPEIQEEDGHTYLEDRLVREVGEAGKKIHTGRSRNDQVAVALRLWLMADLTNQMLLVGQLSQKLLDFGERAAKISLPGYTHLRKAMPSNWAQWAVATSSALAEESQAGQGVYTRLDRCPLGGAAGFGVPLSLDRELVARLLGFSLVQLSPTDVQNSRGRMELAYLSQLDSIGLVLERWLNDIWLYTSEEFGYLSLSQEFTTGSSIMPQKRNPDAVELARACCREIRGLRASVSYLATGLSGSYHRDFQRLKAPTIRAGGILAETLKVCLALIDNMTVNESRCQQAMSDDLYATQAAVDLVRGGMAFRDAYGVIAQQLKEGTFARPESQAETHLGGPGNEGIAECRRDLAKLNEYWEQMAFRSACTLYRMKSAGSETE